MPGLRDEITNTLLRIRGRSAKGASSGADLEETVVTTDPRENRHYGNYRILKRLGVGGMGHVYLAIDTHLGRHAALKFLSPKLKANPEMLARLQQEARTASSLNHPNILTIYDIAEANGEPFIASEFVDGVTLRQALDRDAVDPASIFDIAMQIASALKPAHEAGIVHRDLKPGNVMLRPDGLVKVIDFGLAKFTAQGRVAPAYEALSDPGWVAGTAQYMSPEQARGDEVDHRTDLWSLGVMLYEMVSRQKPFTGATESHIIVAILDHRPPVLKTGSGVAAELAQLVDKALAKDRDQRFQSAEELHNALKALAASSQPASSRKLRLAQLNWLRHRRTRLLTLAIAAALGFLGVALWWWPWHGSETVFGPAWFEPSNYTQVTHRGDVNLAALSPDGKRVAYTTPRDGRDQLHLLNLETHAERSWPPQLGETVGLAFSPSSSTVYYTVHDQREWGRLYAAAEKSTDPVFVLDDVDGPVSFSPDGTRFVFRRRSDEKRTNHEAIILAEVRDTGNQRTILSKYNRGVGFRVAWSPDGVMAMNLPKQSLEGERRPTVLSFTSDGAELAEHTDARLRLLSGPAWLDAGATLIFTGIGRGGDESKAAVVELAVRRGEFRFFASPSLTPNSVTLSKDFKQMAAVTTTRQSTLWVADISNLEAPVQWSSDDSFTSLAWRSDNSIVHPSPRGGSLALWETGPDGASRPLAESNDCFSHQPATVPGQKLLVFSSNCNSAANAANLWVLPLSGGVPFQLTEHSNSDQKPALAPDGDTVLYNSWPSNYPALLKISLRTRAKAQFTSLQARDAAISPNGRQVACQIRENYDGQWRVAILSMRDGSIERDNLPLPAGSNAVVRWSPDGKSLDYVNLRDSGSIWRLPLPSQTARPLIHWGGDPITDFAWSASGDRIAYVTNNIRQDVIILNRGK